MNYKVPDFNIFDEFEPIQIWQFYDKYSKFLWGENRRETWLETVTRTVDYLIELSENKLDDVIYQELFDGIYKLEILPSMRLLKNAGQTAKEVNISIYNCAYVNITDFQCFGEILYAMMFGVGMGFSVEKESIDQLPIFKYPIQTIENEYIVEDSTLGWKNSVDHLFSQLLMGYDVQFDYSLVRPAGSPLISKGGYASGPEPLIHLHKYIKEVVLEAQKENGGKLTELQVYDIATMVGYCVISGGHRRCMPAGSKVQTTNGLINIENIKINQMIAETPFGNGRISNLFNQGVQDISVVTLENGQELHATKNHKVATLGNEFSIVWKSVEELNIDDTLLHSEPFQSEDINYIEVSLPDFYTNDNVRTELKTNKVIINEQFAWIFGKFLADGNVIKKNKTRKDGTKYYWDSGISIATHAKEKTQRQELEDYFLSTFGIKVSHKKCAGNWFTSRIYNGRIAQFFSSLKQPNAKINIPDFIWESNKEVNAAFLAGVADGDGALHNKPVKLCISVYPSFVQELSEIYSSLGIVTYIYEEKRDIWQDIYSLCIKGAKNKLNAYGILGKYLHHNTKLLTKQNRKDYYFNVNQVPQEQLSKYLKNYKKVTHTIANTDSFPFIPLRITSITHNVYEEQTYDIEVENINSFLVDGLLVHNSAMISLFDIDNNDLLTAKDGNYYETNVNRTMANNSFIMPNEQLELEDFHNSLTGMFDAGSGEPGLFNRHGYERNKPERRESYSWGTNACGEIGLRSFQTCNLSTVLVKEGDTQESILYKHKLATIIGTIQSMADDFTNMRQEWHDNQVDERLLGVCISGTMDYPYLFTDEYCKQLKDNAIIVNQIYAKQLNINQAAAITSMKPSGNTSVLTNTSPGLNPRKAPYYYRNVTVDKNSAIYKFLYGNGVPSFDSPQNDRFVLFRFPVKSPDTAITSEDLTAIDQLEWWLKFQKHYSEHFVSVTIDYEPQEKDNIIGWLYENQEHIGGLSFYPKYDSSQPYLPIQKITKEEYEVAHKDFPVLNWDNFHIYESMDETTFSMECAGGRCDI